MDKNQYGLPNALPKGLVEPIEQMDLIMAQLEHDGKENYNGIEIRVLDKDKNKGR